MSEQITPVAVVTGTSTGFGRYTAEALKSAGYRTYATLRDGAGRNAQAKSELEALGITVVELDVTNEAQVNEALGKVVAEAGRVDVLVNNAGSAFFGLTEAFTPDAVTKQFDVNVVGVLRVNRALLPTMRAQKSGLVVYVSSVVGRWVAPFTGVYTASKWAVEALAEVASYELRPFGVDVAIVEPGAYATAVFSNTTSSDDAERAASYGDLATMAASLGPAMESGARDPHEVADAIVALAKAAPGTRALRTVVGGDPRTDLINAATAPHQRAILTDFGMGGLLANESVSA